MLLLSFLAGILATAANRHQAGLSQLSNSRAAERLAELAITNLQQGLTPPIAADADQTVTVVKLNSDGTWIEARATVRGQSASLIGFVPPAAGSRP